MIYSPINEDKYNNNSCIPLINMIWTIIGMCQLSHLWCYCQCHINKLENVVLQKIKNIFIKYYNLLLDRWENSEAMDLLYLKIGRKIKKLLTFNRFWLVVKYGQCLQGNRPNFSKCDHIICHFLQFKGLFSTVYCNSCI